MVAPLGRRQPHRTAVDTTSVAVAPVKAWLARHPRWTFHFTPTSASWLNAVEGFFAKLTRRKLQRGVFPSLVALQTAIKDFVEQHNKSPRPFVWRADPKAAS